MSGLQGVWLSSHIGQHSTAPTSGHWGWGDGEAGRVQEELLISGLTYGKILCYFFIMGDYS